MGRHILLILNILILIACFISWQKITPKKNKIFNEQKIWILSELDSIIHLLSEESEVHPSIINQQNNYFKIRKHYKHIEFFVEYCSRLEARFYINGPLVSKHDEEQEAKMIPPCGLQKIEELLFRPLQYDTTILKENLRQLKTRFYSLSAYYKTIELDEYFLLEMCQLQLFRIASLGLNGFDASITQNNTDEAGWNIEGIEHVISDFAALNKNNERLTETSDLLLKQLLNAKEYLYKKKDFCQIDRLDFIKSHINKLNYSLVEFHKLTGLPWSTHKQALNLQQPYLFGKESFNLSFFSIYYDDTLNQALQAKLGKKMFFDPTLSGNKARSCASCHIPEKAYTDGLRLNISIDGLQNLARNTPTLLNTVYQKAFFCDGRAYQLEQQINEVINNPHEMSSSLELIVLRLQSNKTYRQLFAIAFQGTSDTSITSYSIQKAITEYEKTLVSFNSKFDRYLRGESNTLNNKEIAGYNIFASKGQCGTCYFFPLFNGTVPPYFTENEFEVIGTPATTENKSISSDVGRFAVTGIPEHLHAIKTPSLRNIELTSPYMHNGIYNSVREVIDFYHKGGGLGLGFKVENQTLPFDSLSLTNVDKVNLELFLKTLTDTSAY